LSFLNFLPEARQTLHLPEETVRVYQKIPEAEVLQS